MDNSSAWLLEYKRDIYSQSGEDGIIDKIIEMLPNIDNWCVELGAGDGIHLSNTRNLIKNKGYSAVLIEADKNNFLSLQRNYSTTENIYPIRQLVGTTNENNLDNILSNTTIPINFDLLSIDVDGNDYHIWNALDKYKPKVIIIEFNPTIPTHNRFVQPSNPGINQGSSLLSVVDLANKKGYELVSVLPWNAFFVRKEYYPIFKIKSNSPEFLRKDLNHITYLFSGMDGKIFLQGNSRLTWHDIPFNERKVQQLPKYLQKLPVNYSLGQKIAFRLYKVINGPNKLKNVINIPNSFFSVITKKFK